MAPDVDPPSRYLADRGPGPATVKPSATCSGRRTGGARPPGRAVLGSADAGVKATVAAARPVRGGRVMPVSYILAAGHHRAAPA